MSRAVRRLELGVRRILPALARRIYRSAEAEPIATSLIRRILIIRQHNQLGDMLCVVPLLRALQRSMPAATIDLMASPVNATIMLHHRLLDRVLTYDKKHYLGPAGLRPFRILRLARELRAGNYDLVVVPATVSMSLTSDILAFLTRARFRVGPSSLEGRPNPGAFLYTQSVELDWRDSPHRHQTLRNADVVAGFFEEPDDLSHEITLTPEELAAGEKDAMAFRQQPRQKFVVIHPGAGKVQNRWPAELFAALTQKLQSEFGACVVATIGPMDKEVHELLERLLGEPIKYIVNQPLRRVASIISNADLVVSNDTGVMHVAAAVGTPTIALFGPTDPRQWAPVGPGVRYILGDPIEAITVDQVLSMVGELQAKSGYLSQSGRLANRGQE